MYLDFVAGLLLLGFVFSLVLALVWIPLSLVGALLARWQDPKHQQWSALVTQSLVGVLYAGLIAVSVHLFIERAPVNAEWLYVMTGFIMVFGFLAENARQKQQEANRTMLPHDRAIAEGAVLGHLLGLVGYLVFFFVPALLLALPGADTVLNWTIAASGWLVGFTLVQIVILLFAAGWVFNTGVSLLVYGAMAVVAGFEVLQGHNRSQGDDLR